MRVENNLFTKDSYTTPENTKRWLSDRLCLGNRFHFYLRNFFIFFQTGRCARRHQLDAFNQVHYSNKNFKLTEGCGGKINIIGLNNLDATSGSPVIMMGNHMSLLETAVFHSIIRPHLDFTFVIKKSLLKIPYFGDIMRSLEAIPLTRSNPREDLKTVLKEGKRLLKAGKSIILFPQGTRSEDFSPEKFNSIGIKLAKSAGVPVIPFALKTDFLANGKFLRDLGPIRRDRKIYFKFGKPFKIEGNGRDELLKVIKFMEENIKKWRQQETGN
ncbi:lysophospholipid acyltransferase family protein [Lentisphaerota bacterium ZTH]|nr:1-acyl-sn-glycerol-3-phosphate acyltransferase [Lentisphaerota bacterium]WET07214.1 lysophospholipid acyltransferase family protein [Lentisphaerota bacterium ZTH]